MDAERLLRWVLRFGAVATLLAFPTALLPVSTMVSVHQRLGLGDAQIGPVFEYMARSLSLLYGFHGGLLLLVSFDPRRLAPVVLYLGWMNVSFGVGMVLVDLAAGMPLWWTWGEGPGIAAMGVVILLLCRSARISWQSTTPDSPGPGPQLPG